MAADTAWDEDAILKIVAGHLTDQEWTEAVATWIGRNLTRGEQFPAAMGTLEMPFDGTVVFVDLHPQANFAHPCKYLLIEQGTHRVTSLDASLPPPWAS